MEELMELFSNIKIYYISSIADPIRFFFLSRQLRDQLTSIEVVNYCNECKAFSLSQRLTKSQKVQVI